MALDDFVNKFITNPSHQRHFSSINKELRSKETDAIESLRLSVGKVDDYNRGYADGIKEAIRILSPKNSTVEPQGTE